MSITDPKVIVALDMADSATVHQFVEKLDPGLCRLKVGKELFTATGPQLVEQLCNQGFDVFLDLKFHDIPNTVKKAVLSASRLGIWMLNVHASGGSNMLLAAREGVDMAGISRPFLVAVSVLTSMSEDNLREIGIDSSINEQVNRLTQLTLSAGLDGMVCSAREAIMLRQNFGETPLLVTPGVRPAGTPKDDQHRIMTPREALNAGASYLVIGRPITQHPDPSAMLDEINNSIA